MLNLQNLAPGQRLMKTLKLNDQIQSSIILLNLSDEILTPLSPEQTSMSCDMMVLSKLSVPQEINNKVHSCWNERNLVSQHAELKLMGLEI